MLPELQWTCPKVTPIAYLGKRSRELISDVSTMASFMMLQTKSDLAGGHNMSCLRSIFWDRIQTKHKIPLRFVLNQNGSFSKKKEILGLMQAQNNKRLTDTYPEDSMEEWHTCLAFNYTRFTWKRAMETRR